MIVRSTKKAGSFTVTAVLDGLESDSVTVRTEAKQADLSEDGADPVQPSAAPDTEDKKTGTNSQGQNADVKNLENKKTESQNPKTADTDKTKTRFTKGAFQYRIIGKGKKTVQVQSLVRRHLKKAVIPAAVKWKGTTYKITKIGKNAFRSCKNLKTVIIEKNVTKIDASAFYDCKKLSRVTIRAKKLSSVSKKAFKKVSSKLKIQASKKVLQQFAAAYR